MANVGTGDVGKTLIGTGNGQSPTYAFVGTNSALTNHGVILGQGNSAFVATSAGTNGQVLIAATGADPAFATITSPNNTILFTPTANGLAMDVNTGQVGLTLTATTGGALSPTSGNWNLFTSIASAGTTPFTSSGLTSTVTHTIQRSQAIASTDATKVGLAVFNSANFTVDANGFVSASGSGLASTITGNSGGPLSPSLGNWNVITANSTVKFAGSGSTLTQDFGLSNIMLGSSGSSITTASANVSIGLAALNSITTASNCIAIGQNALTSHQTLSNNIAIGVGAMSTSTSSGSCVAIGRNTLSGCTISSSNTGVGDASLTAITTGSTNCALGAGSGGNLTTTDSNNLLLASRGVSGDNNTIRIGTQGSSTGQQNKAFIAGVTGVTVSSSQPVGVNSSGQLSSLSSTINISSAGEINYPTQPSFLAYLNTTVTDITGDGTQYTVIYDTEVFDQNSDFNLGTSTFTAPVTGRYQIDVAASLIGGTVMSAIICRIVTSNRTYRLNLPLNAGVTSTASASGSVIADMDAADTFTITLQATDTGGKVDDAAGTTGGELRNWVSAQLIA